MSKRYTVTLHHIITVYTDMFDYMDGVRQALAKKKTQWKEDLFFAVKLAPHKLSKYNAEVTPKIGMHLISAHILDRFRMLQSFETWDKAMDINHEDKSSSTSQSQEAFLKNVENEYCAEHQRVPVNTHECFLSSNLILYAMASRSCQSSLDPYDLSSEDEESLTAKNVAEMTPGRSDSVARQLTAARTNSNPAPEAATNWGQSDPNLNECHSDLL